jgi:phospholipase/carboxylesterase
MLPQFGLPGEERITYRDLDFVHRIHMPEIPDGSTLVLLHGSGGSEVDLFPLARKVAPNAMLIGVRGRSTEEGVARFFRRFSMMRFDQKDIISEAEAFAAFAGDIRQAYGVDPSRTVFLGNSNGANMLGAVMQLYPGLVRKAVLLRPMNVLEEPIESNLSETKILSISGSDDLYASYATELESKLTSAGADVTAKQIKAGHAIDQADVDLIRQWLDELAGLEAR